LKYVAASGAPAGSPLMAQFIEYPPGNPGNPMKKSDLDKNEGLKITGQMKQAGTPDRFGSAAGAVVSRREQRKLEQAQGLVAFAVKLDGELVKKIHALADARQTGINETVADLLARGLADKT
jgi:hypothetical protein